MINLSPDGKWRWDGYAWQPNVQATIQVVPVAAAPPIVKDKTTAVLLAVFLGFWTWLYTYQKDAVWFWLNLALSVFTGGFWWLFVSWPWAIIQAAMRPTEFYTQYPYYNPQFAPAPPAPPVAQPASPGAPTAARQYAPAPPAPPAEQPASPVAPTAAPEFAPALDGASAAQPASAPAALTVAP